MVSWPRLTCAITFLFSLFPDIRHVCILLRSSSPSPVESTTWLLFSWWKHQTLYAACPETSPMSCMVTWQDPAWRTSCQASNQAAGPWWWGQPRESSGSWAAAAAPYAWTQVTLRMSLMATKQWRTVMETLLTTTLRSIRASWRTGTWCVRKNGWPSSASPRLCSGS